MKPVRVLHVLGAMNRGGVETWLMHVLRHIDRDKFQLDFLVHTEQPADYDAELLALGSRIFPCPHTHHPLRYAARFLEIARQFGPFDILHSHVHAFSGYTLTLGRCAAIPVRIAHSHNDTRILDSANDHLTGCGKKSAQAEAPAGQRWRGLQPAINISLGNDFFRRPLRNAYQIASRWLIAANCTRGLAVSKPAAEDLFQANWTMDPRFRVLHCGIDLAPFEKSIDRNEMRSAFGFSARHLVFGHVGRFGAQKNHAFLLETAAEIAKVEPRARLLLAGDGPLRPEIEKYAAALGITDRVVFAGLRSDIPALMTSVMDLLLLPSIHEGLPLVVLEAQAAGLGCLVSEGVPEEAIANSSLVRRLPLSAGAAAWALAACNAANQPRSGRRPALKIIEDSDFSISQSVQRLVDTYLEAGTPQMSLSAAVSS